METGIKSKGKKTTTHAGKGEIKGATKADPLESAEKMVEEFLIRSGCMPDKSIANNDVAEKARVVREKHYHSVVSLLAQYRTLIKAYECHKEEFAERVCEESNIQPSELPSGHFFDNLSSRLELLAVQDEKRFQRTYAPQIIAGRRIEKALSSLNFALKALERYDEDAYKLIRAFYIDGPSQPTIREMMSRFYFGGPNTFYGRLEAAVKHMTKTMFGFADNRRELLSILVYLQQEEDDVAFPDF